MEKTIVCVVSKYDYAYHAENIKWNLKLAGMVVDMDYVQNRLGEGLTIIYNRVMKRHPEAHRFIFMHDDVIMATAGWVGKINELFDRYSEYGIIGVAGSKTLKKTHTYSDKTNPEVQHTDVDGRWWTTPEDCYGQVIHTLDAGQNQPRQVFMSAFSSKINDIEEVAVVDGLFIAVDNRRAVNPFDERFRGFHMYDITFCLSNFHENGCKIGVTTNVLAKHRSAGNSLAPAFLEARNIMLELYDEKLPIIKLKTEK